MKKEGLAEAEEEMEEEEEGGEQQSVCVCVGGGRQVKMPLDGKQLLTVGKHCFKWAQMQWNPPKSWPTAQHLDC